jgi:hypothetical protein
MNHITFSYILKVTLVVFITTIGGVHAKSKNAKSKSTSKQASVKSKTTQSRAPTRKYTSNPTRRPTQWSLDIEFSMSTSEPTMKPQPKRKTPTSKPNASNDIPQRQSSPSTSPSTAPSTTTTCIDSRGVFRWSNGQAVDCAWVDKNSDAVCRQVIAKSKCPQTCGVCDGSMKGSGKGSKSQKLRGSEKKAKVLI